MQFSIKEVDISLFLYISERVKNQLFDHQTGLMRWSYMSWCLDLPMPGINHCLNNKNKIMLVQKYCAIVLLCIKLNAIWEVQPSQQLPVNDLRTQSRCCIPSFISKLHLRQETRSKSETLKFCRKLGFAIVGCKRPGVLLQSRAVTNCFIIQIKLQLTIKTWKILRQHGPASIFPLCVPLLSFSYGCLGALFYDLVNFRDTFTGS